MRRFVLIFFLLLIGLIWLSILPAVQAYVVMPWTAFLAQISGLIVKAFDPGVAFYGNVLQNLHTGVGVAILPGCNAVEACIILAAGILAFPASWQLRLFGVLLGVVLVQLINLLRIISLFYLAQWDKFWFDIAHIYLWQTLIMLDVLVFWLLWVRYVLRHRPASVPTATASPTREAETQAP